MDLKLKIDFRYNGYPDEYFHIYADDGSLFYEEDCMNNCRLTKSHIKDISTDELLILCHRFHSLGDVIYKEALTRPDWNERRGYKK